MTGLFDKLQIGFVFNNLLNTLSEFWNEFFLIISIYIFLEKNQGSFNNPAGGRILITYGV